MTKSPTDHDLLTRIDERQQIIKAKLEGVEKCVARSVTTDDEDYKMMNHRVNTLWDDRNKLLGWMIGAGVAGGGISTVLSGLVVKVINATIK